MTRFLDKAIILLCSVVIYAFILKPTDLLLPVLAAVVISGLGELLREKNIQLLLMLLYLVLCTLFPLFLIMLPITLYDLLFTEYQYSIFIHLIVIMFEFKLLPLMIWMYILILTILTVYVKFKTTKIVKLKEDNLVSKRKADKLLKVSFEKNKSILENQDYELNVAILNERNRIAKEIHDHIGHLLSRSLLQIGALLVIATDDMIKTELQKLKHSISEGMDSIRASIHNMHDESVDLDQILIGLIKDFKHCEIHYSYELKTTPLLKIKYCFIAIVKEGLTNIMKYSDATSVHITLHETDTFYHLRLKDNGTIDARTQVMLRRYHIHGTFTDGMGLQNMADRVQGFHGDIDFSVNNGFQIIIQIPKEGDLNHETTHN